MGDRRRAKTQTWREEGGEAWRMMAAANPQEFRAPFRKRTRRVRDRSGRSVGLESATLGSRRPLGVRDSDGLLP